MSKIKLMVYSDIKEFNQNGKVVKSRVYFTKLNLIVVGEESKGRQEKFVTLKFRQDINHAHVKRGIIEIEDKPEFINYPYKYEITKDPKTNKDIYPTVWIRSNDFKYTEMETNRQDMFPLPKVENETDTQPYNE